MVKKILLIEDEAELVELMKMRLEANGYEVDFAYDGEEGLKSIEDNRPDLVLLDIKIPKIDGFEVCKIIKESPATKDIPVVAISALAGKDLPNRCREAGAEVLLFKPIEAEKLLSKIKELLKKKEQG